MNPLPMSRLEKIRKDCDISVSESKEGIFQVRAFHRPTGLRGIAVCDSIGLSHKMHKAENEAVEEIYKRIYGIANYFREELQLLNKVR